MTEKRPVIIGTAEEPVMLGATEGEMEKVRAQWEVHRVETTWPDINPRQVVERVRVHVVEIGDQIWCAQHWRTITAIREAGEGPNEALEPQRHFKWRGNDNWHCYGQWMLRLVGP